MFVTDLPVLVPRADASLNGTRGSDGCLICSNLPTTCSGCKSTETCTRINRDCNQCPVPYCMPISQQSSSSSSGVSKGAVAGAVVAVILVLAATVAGFFWYRRRKSMMAAAETEGKPDVPARAEDVLNRPDPNEKPNSPPTHLDSIRIYSPNIQNTINLDPAASQAVHSQAAPDMSSHSNPFEDTHSIQTTSTGTQSNVIPIALVAPGSVRSGATGSTQSHEREAAQAAANARVNMNLDHINVSEDSVARNVPFAGNNRSSYMTTGSFASEFLETSVIVTPTRGTVKQVVGVAKAEVMRAPESLSRSSTLTKPARSPLAAASFGPADVMREEQEVVVHSNPFADGNSPYGQGSSPAPSTATFGSPEPSYANSNRTDSRGESHWLQEDPSHLYIDERPASVYTQASAIVADISNARRVHLGFDQISQMPVTPVSAALSTPRTPYRLTSAKLVTPVVHQSAALETGNSGSVGGFERQQARALKDLHAESGKRVSMSSVITTSTRADSILESFPFVPPSPISNLPPRTPPRSPLAQQTFGDEHSQSAREMVNRARASASSHSTLGSLVPPNRKTHGQGAPSQSSTMSNGLGAYAFQIDTGASSEASSTAPSSFNNKGGDNSQRKRASLDTLALTSDLSSYPLGFDKPPVPPVPRR
ncbi:uncharacterized protein BXZ73DRAFT_75969 [Epithele typhae]|uniref:uncharacterized protein n=1 Tax=Epithele typhae TaxID=378194 RepID=UPI0020088E9C|nr:uncharacterized protein BXZ73DRAFT_75969 [Epithele typhae]KAH9939236.1 hypothetical protein BXZ73DRAFT_75969 [Epithele typhae]